MKKALPLFLILCIILGIPTATYAEVTSDIVDREPYIYAEKLLSDMGIYDGVEAFEAADGFVKKDIFAVIITRIMKMENCGDTTNDIGLIDVGPDDFAAKEIFTLMSLGVLDVPSDGYYYPGKYITYKEASKALVQVLGYDITVTNKTFDGYLSKASELGILKHVPIAQDERLQVKQLTMMLYNALFVDSMGMSFSRGGQAYEISNGDTLLSDKFNLEEIKGIVSANSITNLNFGESLARGYVTIGNNSYSAGETNAEELIGYKVRAYVNKDTDTLVSVDPVRYTAELRPELHDLEYEEQAYTYYVGNAKKTAKISSKADIIYNREVVVFDKDLMVPHEGEVLLLDHDKDNTYDTVIITASESRVVQEYSKSRGQLAFKYSYESIDLNAFSEDKITVLKEDGTEGKLTSLVEWSVLNICQSLSGNYIEITITNKKISGNVDRVVSRKGKTFVTIGDSEYEISWYYPNKDKDAITAGTTAVFYLNKYGNIAGVDFKDEWYCGYFIKSAFTNDDHDAYIFRIFSEENGGEIKRYPAAKRFRIDDISCDRNGKNKQGTDIVQNKLTSPQLVRYKLNAEEEITQIDTEDTPAHELGLRIDVANGNRKYRANQFMGDISINSNTKVFVVPDTTRASHPDDLNNSELYILTNSSWLVNDGYYNVTSYVVDKESLIADAIVVKRKMEAANLNSFMVEEIYTVYDKDRGEALDKVTGRLGAMTYEYMAPQGLLESNNVKQGDIIAVGTQPGGLLEIITKIYDYETDKVVSQYASGNYDAQIKVIDGYAYNKQNGIVQVSAGSTSLSGQKKVPVGSATVAIYDVESGGNPVLEGTVKDISDYVHYRNADRIICILNYQVLKSVFVYKR